MTVSEDAIFGERLTKSKNTWEPFQATAMGVASTKWAAKWLEVLGEQGMPGVDYILQGANSRFTQWLPRVAEYSDAERALRVLSMLPPLSFSADEAVQYMWHSLRHLYPTIATQLNMSAQQIEDLGTWRRGSGMPDRYNSIAGSRDLMTRTYITEALRQGWRPAERGALPLPAPYTPRMASVPATPSLQSLQSLPATPSLPLPSTPCFAAAPSSVVKGMTSVFALTALRINAVVYLHRTRGWLHLYTEGGWSVCSTWAVMRRSDDGGSKVSDCAVLVRRDEICEYEDKYSVCKRCCRGRAKIQVSAARQMALRKCFGH